MKLIQVKQVQSKSQSQNKKMKRKKKKEEWVNQAERLFTLVSDCSFIHRYLIKQIASDMNKSTADQLAMLKDFFWGY